MKNKKYIILIAGMIFGLLIGLLIIQPFNESLKEKDAVANNKEVLEEEKIISEDDGLEELEMSDFDKKLINVYGDEKVMSYTKEFINKEILDFEITTASNKIINRDDISSKYIIKLASSECPACIDSVDEVLAFEKEHPEYKIITIYLNETSQALVTKEIIKNHQLNPDSVAGFNGVDDKLLNYFKPKFLPTFFFVSKENIIEYIEVGYSEGSLLNSLNTLNYLQENTSGEINDSVKVED